VFDEIGVEQYTKENLFKDATKPKPQDAQRDLVNLVLSAWPKITVCEVEAARNMLQFKLDALPAPIAHAAHPTGRSGDGAVFLFARAR
jgi:hypothetical protein